MRQLLDAINGYKLVATGIALAVTILGWAISVEVRIRDASNDIERIAKASVVLRQRGLINTDKIEDQNRQLGVLDEKVRQLEQHP
jgi:hypothetical protein